MNLSLIPVTPENRPEAEALHVAENQLTFIETVPECLQEYDEIPG